MFSYVLSCFRDFFFPLLLFFSPSSNPFPSTTKRESRSKRFRVASLEVDTTREKVTS